MNLNELSQCLEQSPDTIDFNDVIALIDSLYDFKEIAFKNGEQINEAGENNGSCKLFAFASAHKFSEQQTLNCFAQYYRDDVLNDPKGDSHQNIRNFMKFGWDGIKFYGTALVKKED